MAGIYIHIPFCKQACHYCDFHFSTVRKKQPEMVRAIAAEIEMRKAEAHEVVETIYFGGGTPSVLTNDEINYLLDAVYHNYDVGPDPEITLEANPDDLSKERIIELSKTRINRLSIGIQSFFDDDLMMMNRAHNSAQAAESLSDARLYFENISIDLIYGIPGSDNQKWVSNIEKALSFGVPHISAYALTVEPRTALHKLISTGKISAPQDDHAQEQFSILVEMLERAGFIHYELSNFGRAGFFSRNNTAYWLGQKYIGIGPSAHSYDGNSRSWNVANNSIYINSIRDNTLPCESEPLTKNDRYNEYVMTGLRTIWGVSLKRVASEFGETHLQYLLKSARKFIDQKLLEIEDEVLHTTPAGKFLADGIASDLFLVNLRK